MAEDRTLFLRAGMVVLGGSLGAAGMASDTDWLIYTAMGVIAIGGILAIIRRIKERG